MAPSPEGGRPAGAEVRFVLPSVPLRATLSAIVNVEADDRARSTPLSLSSLPCSGRCCRARALSDEDLQRHFEDLLDAKSEGSRTASAIVEEQVAAIEAEEERPTAWDDVSGSGRESSAFRTEAPSDPQPEDQGLRDADVRVEEDNRVPLAEETFAASAPPPEESNLDTAGAFVKDHLVSFELAGAAVVAASVLAIAARFLGSLLEPRQPDLEPLEEPPTDPPQEEPPSFSRDSGAGYYTRPPAQAGGVVWPGLGAAARSDAVFWTRRDSVDDDGGGLEPNASTLQDNNVE